MSPCLYHESIYISQDPVYTVSPCQLNNISQCVYHEPENQITEEEKNAEIQFPELQKYKIQENQKNS